MKEKDKESALYSKDYGDRSFSVVAPRLWNDSRNVNGMFLCGLF